MPEETRLAHEIGRHAYVVPGEAATNAAKHSKSTEIEVVVSVPADDLLDEGQSLAPDVVILDVRMPPTFRDRGVRGAIAARRLTPGLGILLLSHYVEVACAQELLSSGRGVVGSLVRDRIASLDQLKGAKKTSQPGARCSMPRAWPSCSANVTTR